MKKIKSKCVQEVLVTDPDTGEICEVEIRKLEDGPLVGLDGTFLEQTDNDAFSPYDEGVTIAISNDEVDKVDYSLYPHAFIINYGDGVNYGMYCFPNEKMAKQDIAGFLAQRLGVIYSNYDDGVEFSHRIAKALKVGDVDEAIELYNQVPGNLESIECVRIVINPDAKTTISPKETLDKFFKHYPEA